MSTYCQAGDIARVTFPDGNILDFSQTPINIEVEEDLHLYRLRYKLDNWGYYYWLSPPGEEFLNTYESYIFVWLRKEELFAPFNKYYYQIGVLGRVAQEKNIPLSYIKLGGRDYPDPGYQIRPSAKIYVESGKFYWHEPMLPDAFTPGYQPNYKISVFGSSGDILHEKIYQSNNYFVECVQGCPPNQLDCGDCCLDCNDIFNQISGIRALIRSLN